MYDAIVVGARVAGSPTAMLLARKGYRVLLVDQATFPSDTISTHHIHRVGVAQAKRWGLLDRLLLTGSPKVRHWNFDVGPFALTGKPPATVDGIDYDLCPRRTVLDKMLVDAAAEAGAEVREAFATRSLLIEDGVVRGIRGQSADGRVVEERANIVIGADGRNSLVAHSVAAPEYHARPSLTCGYYSYWSGVPMDGVEIYPREGRGVVAEVTNDGLVYIAAGFAHSEFAAVRADTEGHVLRAIAECAPGLWERMHGARREAPFRGTGDFRFFFRKPYGPGWALVGDAGYHRDAITGQGITDAFRDAELVSSAVDGWLGGAEQMESAMAKYEHCRNLAVMPMFEFTYDLARLAPPTVEQQQLFGALHGNQPDTDRFLGLIAGTTSIPEFMSEANIGRIMQQAQPLAA